MKEIVFGIQRVVRLFKEIAVWYVLLADVAQPMGTDVLVIILRCLTLFRKSNVTRFSPFSRGRVDCRFYPLEGQ